MKQSPFSLHPRLGYQNTDYVLWSNEKDQSLTVILLPEEEKIFLPKDRTHVIKRFPVGKHTIKYCDNAGNVIQEEAFKVENSIKVGGSRINGKYVSRHWVTIVMADRTYFHNRTTHEEFVEYGIHPEHIREVSEDILKFDSRFDCSFFSISQMASILQIKESDLIYYDEDKIIYEEGTLIKYFNINTGKTSELKYGHYMINKERNNFYIYNCSEKCLRSINLKSSFLDTVSYPLYIEFEFKRFIQNQFMVFEDKDLNVHIFDVNNCKLCFTIPLKPILLDNKLSMETSLKYNDDSIGLDWNLSICFLDIQQRVFILKCLSHERYETYSGYSEIRTHTNLSLVFDNDLSNAIFLGEASFAFKDGEFVVFERYKDKVFTLVDLIHKSVKEEKNISLLTHNDIGLYYKKVGDEQAEYQIFNFVGEKIFTCKCEAMCFSYFGRFGAIEDSGNLYYYNDGKFILKKYLSPYEPIIYENGGYYFVKNDEPRPLPYEIKNFTGTGDCLIYEENNQWMMLEWNPSLQKYNQFCLFKGVDRRSFKYVMFCEDHNQLLCQLKDDTFCYYNIETEKFDEFKLETSVVRNFNANQLLVSGFIGKENDKYRRVVYKDPVTLKEITPECLSQYGFFSIDKRYSITYGARDRLHQSKKIETDNGKHDTIKIIIVHDHEKDVDIEVQVSERLVYINYITFSYDSKYMAVVGATGSTGYLFIYDLIENKPVIEYPKKKDDKQNLLDKDFASSAIWLGSFNHDNTFAIYNSNPTTYIFEESSNFCIPRPIPCRNFLCFSPSGRYFASSTQGYDAFRSGFSNWGHQKSTKVFIDKVDDVQKEIGPYEDFGNSEIKRATKYNVGSVAFSLDESKLLIVADDGTFVVRNINLEDESNWTIKEEH